MIIELLIATAVNIGLWFVVAKRTSDVIEYYIGGQLSNDDWFADIGLETLRCRVVEIDSKYAVECSVLYIGIWSNYDNTYHMTKESAEERIETILSGINNMLIRKT